MKKSLCAILFAFFVWASNIQTSFQWLNQAKFFFSAVVSQVSLPTRNQISSTITMPLVNTFLKMQHFLGSHKIVIGALLSSAAIIGACYWLYKVRSASKVKDARIGYRFGGVVEYYQEFLEILETTQTLVPIGEKDLSRIAKILKIPVAKYISNLQEDIGILDLDLSSLSSKRIFGIIDPENRRLRRNISSAKEKLAQLLTVLQTHEAYFKLSQSYKSVKFHREYALQGVLPETVSCPHFDYGEHLHGDCTQLLTGMEKAQEYEELHAKVLALYSPMQAFWTRLKESSEYKEQKKEYERTGDNWRHWNTCDMILDLQALARINEDYLMDSKIQEISLINHTCYKPSDYSPFYKVTQKYREFIAVRPKFKIGLCMSQDTAEQLAASRKQFLTYVNESLVRGYGHVYRELLPQLDRLIEAERQHWAE